MGLLVCLVMLWKVGLLGAMTHWVVTEDGKLQAPVDSLYMMRKPHDLVQFLRQEDRIRLYNDAQSDIDLQKASIAEKERRDDPELEDRLMRTDPDCLKAKKPLAQQNLHSHYALPLSAFGIQLPKGFGKPIVYAAQDRQRPVCGAFLHLPFSPYAFEHLASLVDRANLSGAPETSLAGLVHPGWESLDFGHALFLALAASPNWQIYNLATVHWRVTGNTPEALECVRRALHVTPREYQVIPLLNLAQILHHASKTDDAAVVMDVLLESVTSTSSVAYCAGGEIYALAQRLNDSAVALGSCVSEASEEWSTPAAVTLAAVHCHMDLHSGLLRNVAEPEDKLQAAYIYDHFTYGPLDGLSCNFRREDGARYLHCSVTSLSAYKASKEATLLRMRDPELAFRQSQKMPAGALEQPAEPIDFDAEKAFLAALEKKRGSPLSLPAKQRRYPRTDTSMYTSEDYVWRDREWPDAELCARETHSLSKFKLSTSSLFVSPKLKGLDVGRLVGKELNLGSGDEHPLPWYPPFCHNQPEYATLHLPCCDHLLGLQRAKNRDRELMMPESDLRNELLGLSPHPVDQEAEMGMRLHTLLKLSMGPRWAVYNLAALYWRVVGQVSEAVACARLAAAASPPAQADLALVHLAQLAVRGGHRLDDGLFILKHALQIDALMPATHFLLGHYLLKKDNLTGAEHHLELALELEPRFPQALPMLRALRCRLRKPAERLSVVQKTKTAMKTTSTLPVRINKNQPRHGCTDPCPSFFCLRGFNGEERCYMEEKRIRSHCPQIMCHSPRCIAPPMTAPLIIASLGPLRRTSEACNLHRVIRGQEYRPIFSAPVPFLTRIPRVEPKEIQLDHDNVHEGTTALPVSAPPPSKQTVHYTSSPSPTLPKSAPHLPRPTVAERMEDDGKQAVKEETPLPEVLPEPYIFQVRDGGRLVYGLPSSTAECAALAKRIRPDQPTSTWLSTSAKGVRLTNLLDTTLPLPSESLEPICPEPGPLTMWTMEHLSGYQFRDQLHSYRPEKGLKDAFQNLGGATETLESMATRLAIAIRNSPELIKKDNVIGVGGSQEGGVHWSLSTVAGLYWRVQGNASMAIRCLRHALNNAPYHLRDLALVSLANVYQQSGMLNSALVVASAAFDLNQRFVVIHFTLANIYAAMGPAFYDRAMMFYFSTLALQNNFDPARERIRALYCLSGNIPDTAKSMHSHLH